MRILVLRVPACALRAFAVHVSTRLCDCYAPHRGRPARGLRVFFGRFFACSHLLFVLGWRQRRIRRGGNAGRLDSNGGKAPNATKYFYRTVRRCFFLATPKWSDPQCWHKKRVPGANDMVLITFPKEGGRRFFLIDVDRDINLRYLRIWDDEEGARGLKSIIFRRMSQSFDDLNVGRNGLIVGPSVAIYLMDNIRIKVCFARAPYRDVACCALLMESIADRRRFQPPGVAYGQRRRSVRRVTACCQCGRLTRCAVRTVSLRTRTVSSCLARVSCGLAKCAATGCR